MSIVRISKIFVLSRIKGKESLIEMSNAVGVVQSARYAEVQHPRAILYLIKHYVCKLKLSVSSANSMVACDEVGAGLKTM